MLIGSYLFSDYIEKKFDEIRFKELFGDKNQKIKKGFKNVGKYTVDGFYKKDSYTRIVASETCPSFMKNMDKNSLEYDELLSIITSSLTSMIYNHIHNDEILLDYARDGYYLEDLRIDVFEEEGGKTRYEIHCFMKHKDGRVSGDLEKVLFEIGDNE